MRSLKASQFVLHSFLFLAITTFLTLTKFPQIAIAAGRWATTSAMNTEHGNQSVVTLQNGNVLIVGGYGPGSNGITPVAELYNPSTGTWTETGSMPTPIHDFQLVLLHNGKALAAGGGTSGFNLQSSNIAQLYDPSTGTWTQTGNLNIARSNSAAVTLANGDVLILGGFVSDGSHTLTSELYDPSTGTWTQTGNMNVTLSQSASLINVVLLQNGKVLKVGTSSGRSSNVAELYDPSTGTWTETGNLKVERSGTNLVLLPNGKVLMVGGEIYNTEVTTDNGDTTDCEIYDPSTGTWTQTGSLNYARGNLDATLLPNGKVLVAGGTDNSGNDVLPSELYDPSTGLWTIDASLASGESVASLAPLSNGLVLLADGNQSSAQLYTPQLQPPMVGAVTITPNPVQINTSLTASTTFTDSAVGQTHTATANWGDGTNTATICSVTEPSGSTPGSASCPFSGYSAANVYQVTITVSNGFAQATSAPSYASVFDPTQNSIFSAGEKFDNPSNASPSTSGSVKFGLTYKYNGGTANANRAFKMDFNNANLHFTATSVTSLVISNGMATLVGTGTLTSQTGTYNFLVTGVNKGGIRIQITDSSNNIIYDSQPGDSITATPTTTTGHVLVQ